MPARKRLERRSMPYLPATLKFLNLYAAGSDAVLATARAVPALHALSLTYLPDEARLADLMRGGPLFVWPDVTSIREISFERGPITLGHIVTLQLLPGLEVVHFGGGAFLKGLSELRMVPQMPALAELSGPPQVVKYILDHVRFLKEKHNAGPCFRQIDRLYII